MDPTKRKQLIELLDNSGTFGEKESAFSDLFPRNQTFFVGVTLADLCQSTGTAASLRLAATYFLRYLYKDTSLALHPFRKVFQSLEDQFPADDPSVKLVQYLQTKQIDALKQYTIKTLMENFSSQQTSVNPRSTSASSSPPASFASSASSPPAASGVPPGLHSFPFPVDTHFTLDLTYTKADSRFDFETNPQRKAKPFVQVPVPGTKEELPATNYTRPLPPLMDMQEEDIQWIGFGLPIPFEFDPTMILPDPASAALNPLPTPQLIPSGASAASPGAAAYPASSSAMKGTTDQPA